MRSGTRSGFSTGAAAAGEPSRPAEAGSRSGGADRIAALATLVDSLSAQIDAIEDGSRTVPPPAVAERPQRDERLVSLGRKIAARGDDRLDGIEQRLAAIAEQIDGRNRPSPPRAAVFGDLQASIAEIGARQRIIDQEGSSQLAPVDSIAIEDAIRALRGDIATLGRRIEPLKAEDIGRIVRAEISAQPQHPGIEALRSELDDIRQAIELSARETTLASVEAGYGHVIERLDDIVRRVPERERIDALALEIARIAEHFERTMAPHPMSAELDDIRNAIASFTRSGHDTDIRAEFAALRQIVEQIDATTPAAFSRIEREIGSLREDVGSLQRSDPSELLHRLERQMAEIGTAVGDGARSGVDAGAFSRLEERLDALAGRFDAIVDIPNLKSLASSEAIDSLKAEIAVLRGEIADQEPLRIDGIEDQLSALMQRIDRIASRDDSSQLSALEAEVAALAEKLSTATPDPDALGKVEQNLEKLQGLLGNTRHETIEAARDAARAALAEFAASRGLGPNDDIVNALRDDLLTLQAAGRRSDQQNRDTLEAVHDTLAKVVDRIAELENRSSALASRPHTRHGEAVPLADMPEDHRPLAPGSGKPDLGTGRDAAAAPADPARPGDRKADFIAAARRAAQAAQAETVRIQEAEAAARDARPGPLSRISQALRSRRRPLVFAIAAVLLAIGAAEYGPQLGSRVLDAARPFTAQFDPTVTASVPAKGVRGMAANPARRAAHPVREAAANPPAADEATADAARPTLVAPATGGDIAFQPADPISGYLAANPAPATSAFNPPEPAPTLDLTLVQTAAAKGDAVAAFEMAKHLAEGDGTGADMRLAASWYEKAAKAGLPLAQFRIGSLYERGDGVKRDTVVAQKWYEQASAAGNAQATHNLAVMMSEGANGKADYARAVALFTVAAELGIADSQYNLGVLYARGLGTDIDLAQSYIWFSLAAAQGDVDAGNRRDDVAKAMKADDLARARAAVAAFAPQPLDPAANLEPKPKAEWMQTASVKGADTGANG